MNRDNRGRIRRGFAAALIVMLALLAAAAAEAQTTITVTSLKDPADSGHCTLRDAISLAIGESVSPGDSCTSSGSGPAYTIVFNTGLFGSIMLSNVLPEVKSGANLTITGPSSGNGITIDGVGAYSLLQVDAGATINLQFLTLANGYGLDEVVVNSGTMNLTNCTIANNNNTGDGGAIFNESGTLSISNSTFVDNVGASFAGGILNFAALNINNTTFKENSASDGGAIADLGTQSTVTNSTFVGNSSDEFGGAIDNSAKQETVTNCTFVDNTVTSEYADGAAIGNAGTLTLTNSTFLGNTAEDNAIGGAIYNLEGTVDIKGTILAESGPTGNCAGGITDIGYNIADDSSCNFTTATSQVITNNIGLAPGLGMNGGPTETVALQPNGKANTFLPAADCTDQSNPPQPLTTDQRGYSRPVNGTCSAGAYQYLGAAPLDCSKAYTSNPNLTALLPVMFFPEYIYGVIDPNGGYNLKITGVTQDKPVPGFPLCPNAFWSGTTTYVRTNNEPLQPGPKGLLYQIQFTATDNATGASCNGAATVCVQGLLQSGKACLAPLDQSYDATKCP
jgi:hypothetical protein